MGSHGLVWGRCLGNSVVGTVNTKNSFASSISDTPGKGYAPAHNRRVHAETPLAYKPRNGSWDYQLVPHHSKGSRLSVYRQQQPSRAMASASWDEAEQWPNYATTKDEPPYHHVAGVASTVGSFLAAVTSWVTDVLLHMCPPDMNRSTVELFVKVLGSVALVGTFRSLMPVLVPFMGIVAIATFSTAAISLSTSSPMSNGDPRSHRRSRVHQKYRPASAQAGGSQGYGGRNSRTVEQHSRGQYTGRRVERGGGTRQRPQGDVTDVWYGSI